MQERPILKLQSAPLDKALDHAGIFLLALLWIVTLLAYSMLPETIPVHFNATGKADGYGSKSTLFLLTGIVTVLFGGISLLNQYPHIFNYPYAITPENAERQYRLTTRMLRVLKLALVMMFSLDVPLTYFTANGSINGLGFWSLPLELGLTILPLFYYMWKMYKVK